MKQQHVGKEEHVLEERVICTADMSPGVDEAIPAGAMLGMSGRR